MSKSKRFFVVSGKPGAPDFKVSHERKDVASAALYTFMSYCLEVGGMSPDASDQFIKKHHDELTRTFEDAVLAPRYGIESPGCWIERERGRRRRLFFHETTKEDRNHEYHRRRSTAAE
jgi:hypothetical protein